MCAPKMPTPPDPATTAAAQTSTNISTAAANAFLQNPNIVTPDYRTTTRQTGSQSVTDPTTNTTYDVPTFTQRTTLRGDERRIARRNDAARLNLAGLGDIASGNMKGLLKTPFDPADLPEVRFGFGARNRAEDALMKRLNPQLDRQEEALRTSLVNQGVGIGSEAYSDAMGDMGQRRNDATLAAILAAGQESDRIYNQTSGARSQALNEAFAMRNQPINEVTALLSGAQVSQPNVAPPTMQAMPTVDYAGLVNQNYNQQVANAQMQGQSRGGLFGSLLGAGANLGAAYMMSDERAKEDIEPIGKADDGTPLYTWRYKGDPQTHVGPMAQDVAKRRPEAVAVGPDGLLRVDMKRAFGRG